MATEVSIYYLPTWIQQIVFIIDNRFSVPANPYYLTVIFYLINTGMFIVVSMFFRFHVTLVIQNLTTIEHMDRRRSDGARNEIVNYDMGIYYNFIQIFGKNPWLWFLPVTLKSGKPVGDGVVWPQKPSNAQRYEIDMSIRNVGGASDHGSATRDRTSLAQNEPTPNERTNMPFTSGGRSHNVNQLPPESGYIQSQHPSNVNAQGNYMDKYRAEDRLAQFGAYDNQLSERNRQMYGGMNFGAGAGSFGQNPTGFDQTQQIEGYPSSRSNFNAGDRWNMA